MQFPIVLSKNASHLDEPDREKLRNHPLFQKAKTFWQSIEGKEIIKKSR